MTKLLRSVLLLELTNQFQNRTHIIGYTCLKALTHTNNASPPPRPAPISFSRTRGDAETTRLRTVSTCATLSILETR
eukprot:2087744-Prymnesium_polylepis.1